MYNEAPYYTKYDCISYHLNRYMMQVELTLTIVLALFQIFSATENNGGSNFSSDDFVM